MLAQADVEYLKKRLEKHGQGHLLAFWEHLEAAGRAALLAQINGLEFDKIEDWREEYVLKATAANLPARLDPAPSYGPQPADAQQREKYDQARRLGNRLLCEGRVGAFVVAGGQGTRLGFDGPKGDLPISPVRNKTLFQVFADTIVAASQKYRAAYPWYVMTSPLNHAETIDIFRAHNNYGLNKDDVFIFQQGTLPNFGFDGRILLADKGLVACSPDGHGGSLRALYSSGAVADMKRRGIRFISYWQVDNPLVNIFDPLFIGLHAIDGAEMSSKALVKNGPFEKVGNFCLVDGRVTVIEYSDLPDELAQKQNPDGSLVFELGSIAIHIISVDFVERLNAEGFSLPLHRAVKKIPYINERCEKISPDKPNGIKLESFVFDALPLASKSVILQTLRNEEFAPTKNATGVDSVETTRRLMVERAAGWLEWAGVGIPRRPDGSADCLIEIAPSFALSREDVREKLSRIPEIRPGDRVRIE